MSERLTRLLAESRRRPDYKKRSHQAEASADLRILIARSGLSQKEVAARAGISGPALSKKLGGESNLTLDSVLAIAQAVGCDFDIVYRAEEAPRARQMWDTERAIENALEKADILIDEIRIECEKQKAITDTISAMARSAWRGGMKYWHQTAANSEFTFSTLDWSENNARCASSA